MSEPQQYALQIRVNSGSSSEHWAFDDDFDIRDHEASAWDDMDAAEDMGYRADDLRVVAISPLPPTTAHETSGGAV